MSKLPKRIKIIGKVHVVDVLPKGHPDITDGEDSFAGRIDHDAQRVMLEEGQTLLSEQDTLLHEVFHGVERAMDLDLPETAIHRMATGVLAVIKDNPGFLAYLRRKK